MTQSFNIPVICITGPTATGKSDLGIKLAKKINGEIINADSVQVYQGLDIGSAKPTADQLQEVPHHLVSHVSPLEEYSAGRFRKEALACIIDITKRNKIPIVVGGTGMYISVLFGEFLNSWGFEYGERMLDAIVQSIDPATENYFLHKLLSVLDPQSAERIPSNDNVRVRRALIHVLSTGVPVSTVRLIRNTYLKCDSKNSQAIELNLFPLLWIYEENREILYQKIDKRVEYMMNNGFVEEILKLRNILTSQAPSMKAIGYKHLFSFDFSTSALGSNELKSLIKDIQRDTRRFAKRQMTWWRNQPESLGWKTIFTGQDFNKKIEEIFSVTNTKKQISVGNKSNTENRSLVTGDQEGLLNCIDYFSKYFVDYIKNMQNDNERDVVFHSLKSQMYFARIAIDHPNSNV